MSKIESPVPGYKHLIVEPYTPNIGATIHDIDLGNLSGDEVKAELRRALHEFQVLFFRRQELNVDQQIAVATVFGDPDKTKSFFPRHDQKLIEIIEAKPNGHRYGTDQWHADVTFSNNPPTGTVLYSHIVPTIGGDTLWASGTAVYDSLAPSLQKYLEELEAIHSFESSHWPKDFLRLPDGEAIYRKARQDHLPVTHPIVRTHPVTGRKIVYVNPNFTERVKGLPRQESDALLAFLFARFQRPEVQARLRWEAHTVAIWDNRATVHYATADYDGQHRLMHRVTFGEDAAF